MTPTPNPPSIVLPVPPPAAPKIQKNKWEELILLLTMHIDFPPLS